MGVLTEVVAGVDPGGFGQTEEQQARTLVRRAAVAATAELDDAVAEMVGEVVDHVPEYGLIGAEARRDFVLGVRALTEVALRVLRDGTPATEAEVDAARCIGQSRAQQGLSLQSVEDSIRTCFRVGLRRLCRHLHTPTPEVWVGAAFQEVTQTILGLEHQYVRAIRAGYRHSEERKARARLNREQALLGALLQGTYDDAQQLARNLEEIGYPARGRQLVLLIAAADVEAAARTASTIAGAFERARQVPLVSGADSVVAVLVPDVSSADASRIHEHLRGVADRVAVVVLPAAERLEQVAEHVAAYRGTASVACRLGLAGMFAPLELAPYEVLTQEPTVAQRFLALTLGPVLQWKSARRDAVLATLRSFLRHQAVKRVAHEVGISPQTVYNHLRAIEDATGLSVLKYPAHWHLAFLLRDLYGDV